MITSDKTINTDNLKYHLDKLENISFVFPHEGLIKLGPGAAYDFKFYFNELNEDFQIAAILRDNPKDYFWHMPFEFNYNDNVETSVASFVNTVKILAKYETRIIQTRRFLFYTFCLEYLQGVKWQPIYSHRCFRYSNIKVPNHLQKKIFYTGNSPHDPKDNSRST